MQEALTKTRVLVVDDYQGMRTILRDLVRAMGVPQVDTASNGREAMSRLRGGRYDVVICDFNLGPGLNGQQVLDEARLLNIIGVSTIWIMVTAEKTAEMIMGSVEAKPDEYLIKPINQNILQNRIERLIVKKQSLRGVEEALRAREYAIALQRCNRLLDAESIKSPDLMRIKSDILLKMGDYAGAKEVFESVLKMRSMPWARTGLGKAYFYLGELETAEKTFRQVIEENSTFIEAFDWLAKTLDAMEEKVQAQQVLMTAVKISPYSANRQRILGETAYKNGDLSVAQKAFEKTIKISEPLMNKQPAAYMALARVLNDTGEDEIALKLLTDAKEVFKGNLDIAVQTMSVQSEICHKNGKTELAEETLKQAQELLLSQGGKTSPQTAMEMAKSLLSLGRKDEACELMRTLIKSHHENQQVSAMVQALFEQAGLADEGRSLIAASREEAVSINNQGVMLGREGKFAEGAKLLRVALQNLPNSEVMMMNLCGLLIGQMRAEGRSDPLLNEIMELLNRVRDINPENPKYRQYVNLLRTSGGIPSA